MGQFLTAIPLHFIGVIFSFLIFLICGQHHFKLRVLIPSHPHTRERGIPILCHPMELSLHFHFHYLIRLYTEKLRRWNRFLSCTTSTLTTSASKRDKLLPHTYLLPLFILYSFHTLYLHFISASLFPISLHN